MDIETAAKTIDPKTNLAAAREYLGLGPRNPHELPAIDVYYPTIVNGRRVYNIPNPVGSKIYRKLEEDKLAAERNQKKRS